LQAPNNKYVLQIKLNQQPETTICRINQKPKSTKYKPIIKHIRYTNKTNNPKPPSVEENQKPKSKKYKQIIKHISYTNKHVKQQPQIQKPNGGNISQLESLKAKIVCQRESKLIREGKLGKKKSRSKPLWV
jgi:hypothetical protein